MESNDKINGEEQNGENLEKIQENKDKSQPKDLQPTM